MNEIQPVQIDYLSLIGFFSYLLIIILIGIFSAKFSSKGIANYFIGGRSLNKWVVALSAVVSGRSAWLLLGFTGLAYSRGLSALWAVVGYTAIEFLLFYYYAPRLRRFSEKYDAITIPDFFSARFDDRKGYLRIALVAIIIIFMVSYVSAQFVAGGKTFASSFDISQNSGLIITAVIVLFYTLVGGFLAVSLTDMLQAIFMIIALIVLPIVGIMNFGGFSVFLDHILSNHPAHFDIFSIGFGAAVGFVAIGLGSPGNPHILVRYMSIKDVNQLKHSAFIGTAWNVIMAIGALMIGIVGKAFVPNVATLPNSDPENIFPLLAQMHFSPILFGFIIAAIFAAIMSTCDSQLLVAASAVVRDIYEKIINHKKEIPQKKLVFLSRLVVLTLVVTSTILGFLATDLVFWLVLFAWAGLGASFGPITILSVFWKRTTANGVFAGVIAGTLTVFVWHLTPNLNDIIYELVPAFILSTITTVVVSYFTKAPSNTDEVFEIMKR